jgi:protein ImuB
MRTFIAVRVGNDDDVRRLVAIVTAEYSPNIETLEESMAVFDLIGRQCPDSCAENILSKFPSASIGISGNMALAILLARESDGVADGRRGADSGLGHLSLDALGAPDDTVRLLAAWGITDVGGLAALPEDELVTRLGPEASDLMDRAKGREFRQADWNPCANQFVWTRHFDSPVRDVEALQFVISSAVDFLFAGLRRSCLGTAEARVTLAVGAQSRAYTVKTVIPTLNERLWLRLIALRIESEPPGFDMTSVGVEFIPARLRSIQGDLFSANISEPERIGLVVSKIKKLVGRGNVGVPSILDSWHPKPFSLDDEIATLAKRLPPQDSTEKIRPSRSFFYFPKLTRVSVFFNGSVPAVVVVQGKKHRIVSAGGPWRVDGGWWNDGGWRRDEWDIETDGGALLKMVLLADGDYYLEGGYD